MWRSLRIQLGAIFLAFLLLVSSSVAVTFWLVQTQRDEATLINLAGRQRMLAQQMLWLALTRPDSAELQAVIHRFDQTLQALREGGATLDADDQVVILPPAANQSIRLQLAEVTTMWTTFRANLQPLNTEALQAAAPELLAELDRLVSVLEVQAQARVSRLQGIQLLFLAATFLLLARGYWVIRRHIIVPVTQLSAAARRVSEGKLVDPVPATGGELGQLAHAFNVMSAEVATVRDSLESQVAQRTEEVITAFEFSQEIVQQLDLRQLLRSVTGRVCTLMDAQAASLCLLTQDGKYLELMSSSGGTMEPAHLRQSVQRGFPLRVVGAGLTTVADAQCVDCAFMQARAPGRCAAAPLRAGDDTLGALCVIRDNGADLNAAETRALTLLANAAAIAINNARLAEESRRQSEQNAALAERQKLAAELHDNVAQTLGAINLRIGRVELLIADDKPEQAVQELQHIQTASKHAYGQLRAALTGLQTRFHDGGDLEEKLAECVSQFRQESGLSTDLTIADPAALMLPPIAQTQALHIVREALTNVRRHAQAQHAHVCVMHANGLTHIIIEDDGLGFNPHQSECDNHLGLVIMRTRAERSGGRLTIDSAPGQGTRIEATFPLERARMEA